MISNRTTNKTLTNTTKHEHNETQKNITKNNKIKQCNTFNTTTKTIIYTTKT